MKIYKITEASYSARFYGRRGGRKKKNKAENEPNESNGI